MKFGLKFLFFVLYVAESERETERERETQTERLVS